jgi:hypothetical protein
MSNQCHVVHHITKSSHGFESSKGIMPRWVILKE